jgi:two-component system, sensor histidine kinase PdtaS
MSAEGHLGSPDRFQRYQHILADFSRMVADSSDIPALLQLTAVQAARGIGINHTKVLQHRPALGDLLVVAGLGWRPGVVGYTTFGADPGSVPGQTLQTRQPLIIYDYVSESDLRISPVMREHGIVSLLNVPIAIGGAVWGVLEVDSDTPRHFGQNDTIFLVTMANILGLSLHSRIALQRSMQEAFDAAGALATQKMLLRELEHRFKNDFQLIQSLLMAQGRNNVDEGLRRNLRQVMDRVAAIGMAYDQLSPAGSGGIVELADYLRALCGSLNQRKEGIQIEVDFAALRLPHERAVPLGLIVNELVTNALKHAYPDGAGGVIKVTFEITPGREGALFVSDDGVGMGPPREGSLGTNLVTSCRIAFNRGLLDSWCKSFPTTASCERGADRRQRGHTWHA